MTKWSRELKDFSLEILFNEEINLGVSTSMSPGVSNQDSKVCSSKEGQMSTLSILNF